MTALRMFQSFQMFMTRTHHEGTKITKVGKFKIRNPKYYFVPFVPFVVKFLFLVGCGLQFLLLSTRRFCASHGIMARRFSPTFSSG
jgi:hypothetical protein